MPLFVNRSDIRAARRANLHDFLISMHPGDVEREGDSLRLCCNHSVSIKTGYSGFTDFANGETGNSIDCLTNYLGYGFQDAVSALCRFTGMANMGCPERAAMDRGTQNALQGVNSMPTCQHELQHDKQRTFTIPEPVQGQYWQLFAYLCQVRCIPYAMVQQLIGWGLLYQEKGHGNMVFIDPARTFVELRGSNSFKPFHKVDFSDPAAFWWFKPQGPGSTANVAFVCEGAIDAISLYLLRLRPPADSGLTPMPPSENALYCGIGGVANQKRIDRIKSSMADGFQTVIAVDNDKAGEDCRNRNQECCAIVPRLKDWNADLTAANNAGGIMVG